MKVYTVLYKTMYNNNIYLLLYKKMYNDNKNVCYISSRITRYITNIFVVIIHESVYHIIQDDV